eukprot:TRINITY_DN7270_c0_g1_i1.p1 TRINITY_DN7270_c0_g1~~TRINITY_DN7270_c0_g1_i1.p1  ORF type:complete len:618 (-),score=165.22 TRINITY_DN7270_c0_g1_i1:314-2167(-)
MGRRSRRSKCLRAACVTLPAVLVLPDTLRSCANLFVTPSGQTGGKLLAGSTVSSPTGTHRSSLIAQRALGLHGSAAQELLSSTLGVADLPGDFPGGAAGIAAAGLAVVAAGAFLAGGSSQREDGFKEEDLPPWADMSAVAGDVIGKKPFDDVLLNMRERHGDAFRVYIPSLFGETVVLMGLEANQWTFSKHDKVLDQALGGVVGTAVSGKATPGTQERKQMESGLVFDKASVNFFSNKLALKKATKIFLDASEDFCDILERTVKPSDNVFELLWKYVVQTNADMLYGSGENAATIVCKTIDSINKEGLFSPQVRQAGDDLRTVLDKSYKDRLANPDKYKDEESLFNEFMKLTGDKVDEETLSGLQQFMLTLQLAANGNQLTTIRWMLGHVFAEPELLEAVRQEVWAKLAEKGEGATLRDLELEDLLTLPLCNACITEAVRLHSDIPSKLTLRRAETDLQFRDYKIPKDTVVFLYADAVHKDEEHFPKAGSFCPYRYTDPKEFNKMQFDRKVVTFGHGRKRCTGELHARVQITALMASLALRFDMDLSTQEPGNSIPEDHDGPFIFDAANSVDLVNCRPTSAQPPKGMKALPKSDFADDFVKRWEEGMKERREELEEA